MSHLDDYLKENCTGKVFAVFSGCGKTTFCKAHLNCLDIDTAGFWEGDTFHSYPFEKVIKFALTQGYNVFVGASLSTLTALNDLSIPIVLVLPTLEMRKEILDRIKEREDPVNKIWWNRLATSYERRIEEITQYATDNNIELISLKSGQYASDVISLEDLIK